MDRILEEETAKLEDRLSLLEQLAAGLVAIERPGEASAPLPAWSGDQGDFGAAFALEPLNGYFIDKSRISEREAYLTHLQWRHAGDKHPFFEWLAGKNNDAKDQVLDDRSWRGLSQFY